MIKKYCLLALAVLALSCSVKEESSPLCERVTFEAVLCDKPTSKTVLQADGSVFWSPGDAINLFYGENGAAVLTASNTDAAAQTTFTGTLDGMLPRLPFQRVMIGTKWIPKRLPIIKWIWRNSVSSCRQGTPVLPVRSLVWTWFSQR